MSETARILHSAMSAVDLQLDAGVDPRASLASAGFDLRSPANEAWWGAHYSNNAVLKQNPARQTTWIDGFFVALYSAGQLAEPLDWSEIRRVGEARAQEMATLVAVSPLLSPQMREDAFADLAAGRSAEYWLAGFQDGLSRRQRLTKHRWSGRN